jgi:hypothetical protein
MPARPPSETAQQLEELDNLPLPELRKRWQETFGSPPLPAFRSDYLVRVMAYRIQEQAFGSLTKVAARKLQQAIKDFDRGIKPKLTARNNVLRPGSKLLRDWQGYTHEVTVISGGFVYRDKTYHSLSEVARLITGTRWSGPLFFGLKRASLKGEGGVGRRSNPKFAVDLNGGSVVNHGL